MLLALLRFQRESLVSKLEGIDDEAARSSPVASGTSLLWLAKHVAYAEHLWLQHRFLGAPLVHRNEVAPDDTIAAAVQTYRALWPALDAVIAGHDLGDQLPDPAGGEVPLELRWIVAHLLEEIARHAGHADILRELLDGQTGR